jgi:NADPH:quinone reductase-like Zn-dependent oxidoreductase
MRAVVWTKYGPPDGLQLQEVETPAPGDNEVLIKIHATTVSAGDCEMRTLKLPFMLGPIVRLFYGIRRPKRVNILGQELAGEITEIGKNVTRFSIGDEVFGSTDFFMGAYAQYKSMPEDGAIAMKPANMTYDEAATIPLGGLNALHFLKLANLQRGQSLLINGAGGSIGTIAVQLAKFYGVEVTAVDSGDKLDVLQSIGADHTIDYTQEDFTKNRESYDVIFDVVGKASLAGVFWSLKDAGTFLLGNVSFSKIVRGWWTFKRSKKKMIRKTADASSGDLDYLRSIIEQGVIKTIIDRAYPLEDIVEAHRYVETGQKKGNVSIIVEHEE